MNESWRKISDFLKHRRVLAALLISLILLLLVPLAYSTYTRVFSLDTGTYYFKLDNGAGIKFAEPKIYFDNFTWLGDNGIQFTNLKVHEEDMIPSQFYIYVDKPVNVTLYNVYEKTNYGYYFKAEVKNPSHLITTLKIPYPSITVDKILLYVDGKEALRLDLYDFNHTDYECWHLSSSDIWFKVTGSTVEIKFMNETQEMGGGGGYYITPTTTTTTTSTTSTQYTTPPPPPPPTPIQDLFKPILDFLKSLFPLSGVGPQASPTSMQASQILGAIVNATIITLIGTPILYMLLSRGETRAVKRRRRRSTRSRPSRRR